MQSLCPAPRNLIPLTLTFKIRQPKLNFAQVAGAEPGCRPRWQRCPQAVQTRGVTWAKKSTALLAGSYLNLPEGQL